VDATAIVPAAGKGERFGGAKLIARIDGKTLLDRTLRSLIDAGMMEIVVVTAPGVTFDEVSLIDDPIVRVVHNPDPSRGMFSSIQAGVRVASGDPLLVLPADMPFVMSIIIGVIAQACARANQTAMPAYQGKRGHPVAFPASLRDAILSADPLSTLKATLAATLVPQLAIDVNDPGVLRDVDVREDL
jgi:molybdenum cofactor cytidylyltransferase